MSKVCHMTSAHPVEDVRIFHKECASLAVQGYEVYLVAQGNSYKKSGVHIIGVEKQMGGRLRRMLQTSRSVYKKALQLDADIYHFHDPELLPYALKLKRKGKKVIFDSHEHTSEVILEKSYLPKIIRGIAHWLYSRYQHYVCSKIDAVVTVTPHLTQYFAKINTMTVQVANYPIFNEQLPSSDFTQKKMIFAGRISPEWNHEYILRALEQLPEYRYCLCGSISEDYLSRLKTLPGWHQTDFEGRISHREVLAKIANSSVGIALISPSRNTDWQNGTMGCTKVFEEMMMGLPVVCTDFLLWQEFVERHQCGFCVNPKDVNGIVQALRYLLEHPQEAQKMGENGRKAVKEEFNWDVEKKKLLNLYQSMENIEASVRAKN